MGPRPFDRGRQGFLEQARTDRDASMGPRPFDRGRPRRCPSRRRGVPCFNGSTAFRPWETTGAHRCGGCAHIRLQWVHGLSTVGDRLIGLVVLAVIDQASMGPRPFDRGRRDWSVFSLRPARSFNGSTAFRPWETFRACGWRLAGAASMGPRPFDRGRRTWPASRRWAPIWLQWVHGLSTVGDSTARWPPSTAARRLQWVHGLSTVGDTPPCTLGTRPGARFNGSTAFRPWETPVASAAIRATMRLQWVHGLSTVGDEPDLDAAGDGVVKLQWVHGL